MPVRTRSAPKTIGQNHAGVGVADALAVGGSIPSIQEGQYAVAARWTAVRMAGSPR